MNSTQSPLLTLIQNILSLPAKRFKNLSRVYRDTTYILWHVQVVQPLMAVRQRVAKIMGLAAPMAAINLQSLIGWQI